MPYEEEQISSGFGVISGEQPEQTLSQSYDPFSGLDIDTATFQNSQEGLSSANQDGRISLGLFYFDEDNLFKHDFPPTIGDSLFRQIPRQNLVTNGDGKFIEEGNFNEGYNLFWPAGNWEYCTYDGVGIREITDVFYDDDQSNSTYGLTPNEYYETNPPYKRYYDVRLGGQFPDNGTYVPGYNSVKSTFWQQAGDDTQPDEHGVTGYAGYYPYYENLQTDKRAAEQRDTIRFGSWLNQIFGYPFSCMQVDPEANNPDQPAYGMVLPNFAKWRQTSEAYSFGRCLEFTGVDFTDGFTVRQTEDGGSEIIQGKNFTWSDTGATETDDEDSNQGNILEVGDFLSTEFLPENYDAGLGENGLGEPFTEGWWSEFKDSMNDYEEGRIKLRQIQNQVINLLDQTYIDGTPLPFINDMMLPLYDFVGETEGGLINNQQICEDTFKEPMETFFAGSNYTFEYQNIFGQFQNGNDGRIFRGSGSRHHNFPLAADKYNDDGGVFHATIGTINIIAESWEKSLKPITIYDQNFNDGFSYGDLRVPYKLPSETNWGVPTEFRNRYYNEMHGDLALPFDSRIEYNGDLEEITDDTFLSNVDLLINAFPPFLFKALFDLGYRAFDDDIFSTFETQESDSGEGLNNINYNQYRTLNQVQRIYRTYDYGEEDKIDPFNVMEIKFKMKTMNNQFLIDPDNQPEVEIAIVDGDGSVGSPSRTNINLGSTNESKYPDQPNDEGTYDVGHTKNYYYYPHGDFNLLRYDDSLNTPGTLDGKTAAFGTMGRFKNTELDTWETFSYKCVLGKIFRYSSGRVRDLHLIVQAANNFYGQVYLDEFEVYESGDFIPDVDVRKKISTGNYGTADLTKYYDEKIQPDEYKDTTAPLEAQFYFYPTYPTTDVFDIKRTPMYNDYKKGLFYIYDVDWGDGTINEFTSKPEKIDEETALYHTYKTSGIFEIVGYMIRMKGRDDTDEPIGIMHTKRFRLRININEGGDEEFKFFGSEGFSFIPFKNTTPIIGGYSNQSMYYKFIKRQLGFIGDNTKTTVEFKNKSDKLKTELALLKMDSSRESEFEILPDYSVPIYDRDNFNELIYNGISPIKEELGKSIGDADVTNIKFYNTPKSIWEMFGFDNRNSNVNLVAREGEFINRRTGELVPDGTLYHIHPNDGPMEGAVHNPNIQGGTEGHDYFDNTIGLPMNDRYWKNIIPKDYSIFNREGVVVESDNEASYIDVYNSEQDFRNNFYYPVLPKYNLNGQFMETIDEGGNYIPNTYPNNKIPFSLEGLITNEFDDDINLILNITSEDIESNALRDMSGNNNLGMVIGDYKPNFDNKSLQPKKTKTHNRLQSSKINGAF